MTTFSDLKSRIADELDRTDINSQIDRHLKRAVEYYEKQRWWFTESITTTTASQSTASIALPTDLLILDNLETVISGHNREINEVSWQEFQDVWRANTSPGQPQEYAIYSDRVFLGPFPNIDYKIIWSYVKTFSPASFTDGTDNAWTNFGEDMISARAEKTLAMRLLDLTPQKLSVLATAERDAYNNLCGLNEQRLMSKTRPYM